MKQNNDNIFKSHLLAYSFTDENQNSLGITCNFATCK